MFVHTFDFNIYQNIRRNYSKFISYWNGKLLSKSNAKMRKSNTKFGCLERSYHRFLYWNLFRMRRNFFSIFFIVLDRQWQIKIRSVLRISKKITNWIFNVDGNVKHKNIKVHEKCTIHLTSQSLNSKAQLNNWFESIEFRFSVENDLPVTWRRRRKKRMRLAR